MYEQGSLKESLGLENEISWTWMQAHTLQLYLDVFHCFFWALSSPSIARVSYLVEAEVKPIVVEQGPEP